MQNKDFIDLMWRGKKENQCFSIIKIREKFKWENRSWRHFYNAASATNGRCNTTTERSSALQILHLTTSTLPDHFKIQSMTFRKDILVSVHLREVQSAELHHYAYYWLLFCFVCLLFLNLNIKTQKKKKELGSDLTCLCRFCNTWGWFFISVFIFICFKVLLIC